MAKFKDGEFITKGVGTKDQTDLIYELVELNKQLVQQLAVANKELRRIRTSLDNKEELRFG